MAFETQSMPIMLFYAPMSIFNPHIKRIVFINPEQFTGYDWCSNERHTGSGFFFPPPKFAWQLGVTPTEAVKPSDMLQTLLR